MRTPAPSPSRSVAGARPDLMFVAAAGNNGMDDIKWDAFPGSYPEVISVAAVVSVE